MSSDLTCGYRCAKYFLFFFNIIFWLVGAALLAIGIWFLVDPRALQFLHVTNVSTTDILVKAAAGLFVGVGGLIFITGFFGCCGACKESGCMLTTYAVILIFLFLAQIAAGILAVIYRDKIVYEVGTQMSQSVQTSYGADPSVTDAWDLLQRELQCCGSNVGPSEWHTSSWYSKNNNTSQIVPYSCCIQSDPNVESSPPLNATLCVEDAARNATSSSYLYTQPCESQLVTWIHNHAAILIGVAFGLAVIQIFVIILACCLRSQVVNQGVLA